MSTILLALAPKDLTDARMAHLRRLAPDHDVLRTNDRDEIAKLICDESQDVEIVFGHFPTSLAGQATTVRWIQQWGAGADWLMRHPEAAQMDFTLTNASGVHAVPITEHIFAFLLARHNEGAANITVLDKTFAVFHFKMVSHFQRRGAAGVGDRYHHIDIVFGMFAYDFLHQLLAHA